VLQIRAVAAKCGGKGLVDRFGETFRRERRSAFDGERFEQVRRVFGPDGLVE